MLQQLPPEYRLTLALGRREREARAAALARLAAPRPPRRLRRTVGLGLVRVGRRLAAEPTFRPATTR
jgi:hypothetical protein